MSFEPPPWLEFTIRLFAGSATRVSPPGTTHTSRPSFTANGRRSRWRAPIRPSTNVGAVDSATGSCAIQPRGSASTFIRRSESTVSLAAGPITMPLPPEPSTGLNTSSSIRSSTHSHTSTSSSR